jgi:hypothetical protein
MSQSAGAFGQQALEFIEEVDRVGSPAVVVETVYRVLKGLGFEGLFFVELDPRRSRSLTISCWRPVVPPP